MRTTVRKIGNSLGSIIPAPVAREFALEAGSEIEISMKDGKIIIEPISEIKRLPFSEKDLLKGLTAHTAHADELSEISPTEWGE
nr:AbrB/MazE/SpoVT family DNA-binding domain-containing protein [uncultured Desulfobulbus sp.]